MNNPVEINKFLKYYAKIYKQNPELPILRDTIYHGLMTYGLKEEDKIIMREKEEKVLSKLGIRRDEMNEE